MNIQERTTRGPISPGVFFFVFIVRRDSLAIGYRLTGLISFAQRSIKCARSSSEPYFTKS